MQNLARMYAKTHDTHSKHMPNEVHFWYEIHYTLVLTDTVRIFHLIQSNKVINIVCIPHWLVKYYSSKHTFKKYVTVFKKLEYQS